MPIKPIDIRRKEFGSSFRGYDQNGVDDFLDQVADEFERTYTDNVRMRDEIQNLRERLQQFEDLEGSIQSALVHAEQAANDLRESARREADTLRDSARREADLTVKEAQNRAHQMLADSSSRVERVQESYDALREARQKFAAEFRHLLHSYISVMDNVDIASAKEIEASLRERLDTESIAAAREAAAHRDENQPALTDADDVGPAGEGDTAEHEWTEAQADEFSAQEDPEATQAFTPPQPETSGRAPERETPEPEVEEPEIEPSSVENASEQETMVAESPAAAEEVDREEPGLASERRSDAFFDEGSREETAPSEEQEDNRIFRASRFLRRRG